MNKLERHHARMVQAEKVYAAEVLAADRIYRMALDKALDKCNLTCETSRRQMENEPND